jgi:hypothetical protein
MNIAVQALMAYGGSGMKDWATSASEISRLEDFVDGLDEALQYCTCEPCIRGRMREVPHRGRLRQAEYVGKVIHADVCGHSTSWATTRKDIGSHLRGHSRFSGTTAIADRAGAWTFICNFVQYLEGYEPQRRNADLSIWTGRKNSTGKDSSSEPQREEQHCNGQQPSNVNPTGYICSRKLQHRYSG